MSAGRIVRYYDGNGTCDACSEYGRPVRVDEATEANICQRCDVIEDTAVIVGAQAAGVPVEQFQRGIDAYHDSRHAADLAEAKRLSDPED